MLAIAYSLKNITCVNKDIITLNQSHLAKIMTLNFSFHIHAQSEKHFSFPGFYTL